MTRVLEILISLAIVAVLFVLVGVLLPSSRHQSHSVETNRKMTIVFDTLNSLRRFKEWNPLYLKDPGMKLTLSGPESGVGAKLSYESQEERLGKGSWEITDSTPGKRVAYKIEDMEHGGNKRTVFTLSPTGQRGRNVEINQTYDVEYGWNLIGRYAGLYVSSNVGAEMKMGLSRLSNMLATVPNFDYAEISKDDPSLAPKLGELPAENVLALSASVPRGNEEVKKQMNINLEWIKKVMDANNLEAAGPVRIVTNELGSENYSFDVVQPVKKKGDTAAASKLEVTLSNNVTYAFNEPRKVATMAFTGHMANLPRMRDALRAWSLTRGHETIDRPYETWKGGIESGFTETGTYDLYWNVKK